MSAGPALRIAVASGKGGTGKTTVAVGLAIVAGRCQLLDCDVDAPDLYLLLHPDITAQEQFRAGQTAAINHDRCSRCVVTSACPRWCASTSTIST